MLQLNEGRLAVQLARNTIENHLQKTKEIKPQLTPIFTQKSGAFVTLHTYPQKLLRGCIGIPYPIMPLQQAITEAALSVIQDPRFPPLTWEELTEVVIEITVLSSPILISINSPKDYMKKIIIGKDGLIAEKGYFKGLLLPQVPIEQGWDVEEFLNQTCMKAGLPPDSWIDIDTKIYHFSGQIFTEMSPKGDIKEKKIDGSNN